MQDKALVSTTLLLAATGGLLAQSNVDSTNKYAWEENVGWTNWRDANATADGVIVGPAFMSGFVWGENVGWINVGNGAGPYANTDDSDFGVNIDPDGTLHGFAWGENVGWFNFDGGAMATPAEPARIECSGRLDGFVWGENVGWLNLSVVDAGKHVAVDAATTPLACDLNKDGIVDGEDVQIFTDLLISGGADWQEVCSGDLEGTPDGMIELDDLAAFVTCLLS